MIYPIPPMKYIVPMSLDILPTPISSMHRGLIMVAKTPEYIPNIHE